MGKRGPPQNDRKVPRHRTALPPRRRKDRMRNIGDDRPHRPQVQSTIITGSNPIRQGSTGNSKDDLLVGSGRLSLALLRGIRVGRQLVTRSIKIREPTFQGASQQTGRIHAQQNRRERTHVGGFRGSRTSLPSQHHGFQVQGPQHQHTKLRQPRLCTTAVHRLQKI